MTHPAQGDKYIAAMPIHPSILKTPGSSGRAAPIQHVRARVCDGAADGRQPAHADAPRRRMRSPPLTSTAMGRPSMSIGSPWTTIGSPSASPSSPRDRLRPHPRCPDPRPASSHATGASAPAGNRDRSVVRRSSPGPGRARGSASRQSTIFTAAPRNDYIAEADGLESSRP